jgi:thiol-disulfide isomerase/thioredoxin
MVRLSSIFLLLSGFSLIGFGQAAPAAASKPDAATMLQQIGKKYAEAKCYHIEAVQVLETKGEFTNDWHKSNLTAIVAPGNRYRFEGRTQFGSPLKVSDGKTETDYHPDFHEYTQQPAPESVPVQLKGSTYEEQFGLLPAMLLLKNLFRSINDLHFPSYVQDDTLSINGKQIPCYVIKGKDRYHGGSPDVTPDVTLWIDQEELLVRKLQWHAEGSMIPGYSRHVTDNQTTVYTLMEINNTEIADASFSFQPPADARLVQEFSDPRHPKDTLAGNPAPAIKLQNTSGKSVMLQDFHGKPVLLDFWATWCSPCVAAVESLKKLHAETEQKGMVILSIDEDENADIASKFLAQHGISWSNFHDDGEMWRAFRHGGGIPLYVLVDSQGQIAFAKSGMNDAELRAALAKSGIDIAADNTKPNKKP